VWAFVHTVYGSSFSVDTVSSVPIPGRHSKRAGAELALQNAFHTSFNTSVPLHYRDLNGMRLGQGMRGWALKEHGPMTDALRSTGEIRVKGGSEFKIVVFSDLLAYPRKVAWIDPNVFRGKGRIQVREGIKSFSRLFYGADGLEGAAERLQKALNQKVITKTAVGVGVRARVKGHWVKIDVAKLNSCHTKLHLGLGTDFSIAGERELERLRST